MEIMKSPQIIRNQVEPQEVNTKQWNTMESTSINKNQENEQKSPELLEAIVCIDF